MNMTEFDEEELAAFRVWKDRLIFSDMAEDYADISALMSIMHRYVRLSGCPTLEGTGEADMKHKVECLDLLKGSLQ